MARKRPIDLSEKRRELLHQLNLAEEGDAAAQNAMGATLAQGYFVRKDLAGAAYWYAQAAKQGYTHAKWNLGSMLVAGEGVPATHRELGMELIEQAGESGDVSACLFLADCYLRGGFGLSTDLSKSQAWSARAEQYERFIEHGEHIDLQARGLNLEEPRVEWKT